MHIALNMLFAGAGVAGGRVYAEGLLRGLAEVAGPEFKFTIFTRRDTELPALPADRFAQYRAPVSDQSVLWRTWWEYGRLPRVVRAERFDLFHGLGNLSPTSKCPFILTVHDLIHWHFRASTPLGHRLFMRLLAPRAARRADRVLVPSQATARDVITTFGVREDRLRIVPYGPGLVLRPDIAEQDIGAALDKFKIRRPYLLSVARGYPHKNLLGLLRALPILERYGWPDAQLVLAGDRYLLGRELQHVCEELKLNERLIFTGFVTTSVLNALYCGATAFVFPSQAEGFGMPPLEAMACGVPVVASNVSAIPEVVGDAGLLVDARAPEALAAALARVLSDAELRAELRRKGVERASQFTWQRCAAATAAVYREFRD
jgi:glycosyltransferase involved in cell wall biosynthesis